MPTTVSSRIVSSFHGPLKPQSAIRRAARVAARCPRPAALIQYPISAAPGSRCFEAHHADPPPVERDDQPEAGLL
ncbi:MAG: hypothetical protein H6531_04395 [Actinobacteria bacterium]|nr:hypothetical protein [Actinomycetota bacterium]